MACISLPTAMLIGGGLSAAGGVASAVIGSNAAQGAAKTQAQAAAQAQQNTMQMFGQVKDILNPFVSAGTSATTGLQGLLGLNPDGTISTTNQLETLKNTPGYQFALQQGLKSTQNSYAAQGLGISGSALRGAADYAEGLAGTTYQNQVGNYFNLAQLGENAGSALAGYGTQSQAAANQYLTGGASALAAGQIGSANAITQGITSALGGVGNTAMMLGLNASGMFAPKAATGNNPVFPFSPGPYGT